MANSSSTGILSTVDAVTAESSERRYAVLIEWTLRIICLIALAFSVYLLSHHQYLVSSLGSISSISVGSVGALFILSEYSFSRIGGMKKSDAIVFAILFPAAFLWTYEIIYHFSFPLGATSGAVTQLGNIARYVATAGLPTLSLVLLRKELTFKRISAFLLGIFAVMWIFWLLYGFPQYFINGAVNGGKWLIYSPPILKNTDPWDTSLFFNFGSKTILAMFFASILKMSYRAEAKSLLHWLHITK
jgi:hypothetical protein